MEPYRLQGQFHKVCSKLPSDPIQTTGESSSSLILETDQPISSEPLSRQNECKLTITISETNNGNDQSNKIQPINDKPSLLFSKLLKKNEIVSYQANEAVKQQMTLIEGIQQGQNLKFNNQITQESKAESSSSEQEQVTNLDTLFKQEIKIQQKSVHIDAILQKKVAQIKCIIMQNDKKKLLWDVLIMIFLVFVAIILPYRMAFYDSDPSPAWMSIWLIIDVVFLADVILTFCTTFTDSFTNVEVFDHKRIALRYLKGWFVIDLISCIPFDIIIEGQSSFNTIARISRTSRLYKMIRLLRLLKIYQMAKSAKIQAGQAQKSKISYGTERLLFFTMGFALLIHVFGCFFVIIAQMEENYDLTWVSKCPLGESTQPEFETYICSIYFVLTTTATVGYGDISPTTSAERIFSMMLMFIGVVSFSFLAGQLGSIMQNIDERDSAIMEKVLQINQLQNNYEMKEELISNIRKEMNFDQAKTNGFLENIYKDLPTGLRQELMCAVHDTTFTKFPFFQKCGNKFFITWVSNNLEPRTGNASSILYQEDDLIQDFYFQIKGVAAFIKEKQSNQIIGIIDPEKKLDLDQQLSQKIVFQSFGCEDSVYNHLLVLIDIDKGKQEEIQKQAENCLNQRRFTVECITQCEYLVLGHSSLDIMKKNFQQPSRAFFKFVIEQFRNLLTVNCNCLSKFQTKLLDQKQQKVILETQRAGQELGYQQYSVTRINEFANAYKTVFWQYPDVNKQMKWSSSDDSDQENKKKKMALRKQNTKKFDVGLQTMSDKTEKQIMKIVNNFKGTSRLAQVLMALKRDKLEQEKQNGLSARIKQSIQKKIKESIIEFDLLYELPKKKIILIKNLLAEQKFKIWINSLDQNERAMQEFHVCQEKILQKIEQIEERFQNLEIKITNLSLNKDQQIPAIKVSEPQIVVKEPETQKTQPKLSLGQQLLSLKVLKKEQEERDAKLKSQKK